LKVLPFAAMLDQKQLQRFQNEARAAASLRHPNIVQVHFVGCERAVHFYAMDYIEGQTLAEVIRSLCGREGLEGAAPEDAGKVVANLADSLASGRFAPPKESPDPEAPAAAYIQEETPGAATDTNRTPQTAIATERSTKNPAKRYDTAQDVADDLKRFLEDKPIRARPPSLASRAAKWARRHRAAVTSAALAFVMATVLMTTVVWDHYQRRVELKQKVSANLGAAEAFLHSEDYTNADRQLGEATGYLKAAEVDRGPLVLATADLSKQVSAKRWASKRFSKFQELRKRVHSGLYHNDPRIQERAKENCRAALELYSVLEGGQWKGQAAIQDLSSIHREMLDEHVAELLFLLAHMEVVLNICDVEIAPDPAAIDSAHRRAIDALRRIETFHQPVSAAYLWIADSWEVLGEEKLAQDARQRGKITRSVTALDYYVLGEFQLRHDHLDQALKSYAVALRHTPDHNLSLLASGVILNRMGRHEAAEAMLTGAIAMNQNTTIAYIARGLSCLMQGKHELAEADFNAVLKLDPRSYRAYQELAFLYKRTEDFAQALAMYDKALAVDPGQYTTFSRRGSLYERLGNHEKAVADFTRIIEILSPRVSTAKHSPMLMSSEQQAWAAELIRTHCGRALSNAKLGQTKNALEDLRIAESLAHDTPGMNEEFVSLRAGVAGLLGLDVHED
jgi:tetratricopeptide (TPR) repeat protein